MQKNILGWVAGVVVILAVTVGGWALLQKPQGAADEAIPADAKLAVIDVANREVDGAPALIATFSIPLSSRSDLKGVHLYEVGPAAATQKAADEGGMGEGDADEGEGESTPAAVDDKVSSSVTDADIKNAKEVKASWKIGANARLVETTDVKPAFRYIVRIDPGMTATNGATLAGEARFELNVASVSPAYYFASNGTVLPAKQNGGLPVTTVNVPEVDIEFLRIRDDQVGTFMDRVIAPVRKHHSPDDFGWIWEEDNQGKPYNYYRTFKGAVYGNDLDTLHRMSQSVFTARFLTEQKQNKRSVTFIPVEDVKELQEPGIYVAVMTQPGRFRFEYQTTYFYVSDLGLHARTFENSADAYVSSLLTGKALSGVEVSWMDQDGKVLLRQTTDGDGHAAFTERPKNAHLLVAKKDKQVSILALKEPALDLSEFDTQGLIYKPVHLFPYAGRDLFRPGESMDLSVLARDADGHPVPPQPIEVKLKRPDGQDEVIASVKPEDNLPGYYTKRFTFPTDAATGTWTLETRADPADRIAAATLNLHVEEFLPERMKLDLAAPEKIDPKADTLSIAVHGAYLYGAPAAGNHLTGVVAFERAKNPLAAQLPGFEFGDAGEEDQKTRNELDALDLDPSGAATVNVSLAPSMGKHSPFLVRTTLSLLESGGRPVVRNLERIVWPAAKLIGVRPLFTGSYANEDGPVDFEVVRVDQAGAAQPEADLPVRLFREDRQYYWRFDDQRGWNSGFSESDELVATQTVSVQAGARGKLRVPVRYGRYRLEIDDPESHQTLKYRFYAGWSFQQDEQAGVRPDRVALELDKPAYNEGDTITVKVKAPHDGTALITLEGDRTLWVKRTEVSAGGTTISVPLDKSWARHDLYLTALVLRPGDAGDRVTPTRALGLQYIPLERSARRLALSMEAPAHALPETTVHVHLKSPEAAGHPAVVTLSAVDVGILNITNFPSPDPFAAFFGKMRYATDLRDVYGHLIEKYAGQKGKLRFGGDDASKAHKSPPKKVKLVDLFSGPVRFDDKGEADVPLVLPDFNGTLRLMAVAATADHFAAKDAEMTIAAPIVAELSTPRFLSFGDTATIGLDVHNLSGHDETLSVTVKADPGLNLKDATRQIVLKNQEKQTLRFAAEAGQLSKLVPVTVSVTSPDVKINRSFALQVEAPFAPQRVMHRFVVKPGDTVDLKSAEVGGFFPDTVDGQVTVSSEPPFDMHALLKGLLQYPYGCVEQTTSTAYPFVFVDEAAARRYGITPHTQADRAAILEKVMEKLSALQAPSGGFSLWGGASNTEYWLTAYVTNFLLDAKDAGFAVPETMQTKALDFLLKGLQTHAGALAGHVAAAPASGDDAYFTNLYEFNNRHFDALAYGAYDLARVNRAPLATLRTLHEARAAADSKLALAELAVALKLAGDAPRSLVDAAEAVKKVRPAYHAWWGEYGSELRDAAMAYSLFSRNKLDVPNKADLLGTIVTVLGGANGRVWLSTQEQLALFLAGQELENLEGSAWQADLTAGGQTQKMGGTHGQSQPVSATDLGGVLKIANTGPTPIYVSAGFEAVPTKAPNPAEQWISVTREVLAADGSALDPKRVLKVGESVLVHVSARSRELRNDVLVIDRVPAGLEIENTNIAQGEGFSDIKVGNISPAEAMQSTRITHVEFRDDRFVAAVKLAWWQPVDLFYRARVVTPGRFVAPGAYAEEMYRPDIFGTSSAPDALVVTDGTTSSRPVKADPAASSAQ